MSWDLERYVGGFEGPDFKQTLRETRKWMEQDNIELFKQSRAKIMGEMKEHLEDMDRVYRNDPKTEGEEDEESKEEEASKEADNSMVKARYTERELVTEGYV